MTAIERAIVGEGRRVQRLARHIGCLMEHERERFCSADARKDLALLVRTYLAMRQDAFKFSEQMLRRAAADPMMARAAHIEAGLTSRPRQPGNAPHDASIIEAAQSLIAPDPDLLARLADLTRDGYITSSDFSGFIGLFLPSELAPMFASIKPERQPCP